MRYAQKINRNQGWKGHLWQGRFFSSPLGNAYLWAAIRYVERNPVRAKIVVKVPKVAEFGLGMCASAEPTAGNEELPIRRCGGEITWRSKDGRCP